MQQHCQILLRLSQKPLTGDLDFTLWDHEGEYSPFQYTDGNLAIPLRLIKQLYNDLYKLLLDTADPSVSKCVLMLHPENLKALNIRRKLSLDPQQEFEFTSFLLSKHCNCSILWSYRFHLRQQIQPIEDDFLDLIADRYPKNYPLWTYRVRTSAPSELVLERVQKFNLRHLSDYSAWHFRQQILKHLSPSVLETEQRWITSLIHSYPERLCLWLHLRFLHLLAKHRSDWHLITLDLPNHSHAQTLLNL
ncbi:hypothetical protein EDD86DRAFT_207847 [Gorgonomyces haynaldii]|nr:hypothetical protein EDD86DRAFT_207847 [Gorgonomyces haynaldii]